MSMRKEKQKAEVFISALHDVLEDMLIRTRDDRWSPEVHGRIESANWKLVELQDLLKEVPKKPDR